MSGARRLRIAYVVPGHNLLPSAGPTRNVLNLAGALGEHADVTVVFRSMLEPLAPQAFRVLEIEPSGRPGGIPLDDAAARGVGLFAFFSYLRSVDRWVRKETASFDVVLEKSWLLSGYVAQKTVRAGVPGVLVENIPPMLEEPIRGLSGLLRLARHRTARAWAGRCARSASRVIVETEELKVLVARGWRIPEEKIAVVGLGVDRALFRPRDREEARAKLGVRSDAVVLLYSGVLDRTHTLVPLLTALRHGSPRGAELHIAGDGSLRETYERIAREVPAPVLFHGRIPHETIPEYIAAADLCLAPYDASVFLGGEVVYSTLKIPEYLASGRAVASVPSGNIRRLIRSGETGFLLENTESAWALFFSDFPPREQLREMGERAGCSVAVPSWEETARSYLAICEEEVRKAAGRSRVAHPRREMCCTEREVE
ncbi:MAG: glycosyltransferase [Candidatus Eisenbacteria bacterium]|nr:glycosyltransferase [Candidatus Eisenbacteria bacterium]